MNIAVITPISHLKGVHEFLQTKGKVFILEKGTKKEVHKLLLENSIDTII